MRKTKFNFFSLTQIQSIKDELFCQKRSAVKDEI